MNCPLCGQANDAAAKFCSGCGVLMPATGPERSTFAAQTPAASVSPEEYYRAVVGPKNQDFYVKRFERFDALGTSGPTWHWPAFFVTFYWFLYRKMWVNALIYFISPYVITFVGGFLAATAGTAATGLALFLYGAYLLGIFVVLPMYANALYYRHCKSIIAATKASTPNEQRLLGELSDKGGTSNIVLIIVIILGFIFVIGILAAVAIPAYQDYVTRAKMAEAVAAGTNASEKVGDYYQKNDKVPASLEEAGYPMQRPQIVGKMSVDGEGVVTLTMSSAPVLGKTLKFVPTRGADNKITWTCMSEEIPNKWLPPKCRSAAK